MSKSKKRRRAARPASERPERRHDPRLVAARALAQDGVPFERETWVLVVSPARMGDGRVLMWHPPQPVAFNLIEAKRYRDRGGKLRRSIMAKLKKRPDEETYGPQSSRAAIDCLRDLQAAVLCGFTAIESLANHAIDMLPADATVTWKGNQLPKADLVRGLGVDEKLKLILPIMEGGTNIAGTATWERYRELKFLRDELLHVKQRGYKSNPDDPSAYDCLMLGEGDRCVEDAFALVDAAWPGFLPEDVRAALRPN